MAERSSKNSEKVSIIIPFYNCRYVDRSIKSALAQTYKNIEIIVIDDGSTKFIQKLQPYLKHIKYIRKKNGGTATALNEGIKQASGEYFVWLSSDDEFHPNKVALQLDFMKKMNAKFSFTNFIYMNALGKATSSAVSADYSDSLSLCQTLQTGCPINGSTVMMEVNLFKEVGPFDESLKFANDYDMWVRIALKHKMCFLNEPLTAYRVHHDMGTNRNYDVIKKEASKIQKKYGPKLNQLIAKYRKGSENR